eukprot:scaffold69529_cov45-Phaeocystis_antarctica.AAC.1
MARPSARSAARAASASPGSCASRPVQSSSSRAWLGLGLELGLGSGSGVVEPRRAQRGAQRLALVVRHQRRPRAEAAQPGTLLAQGLVGVRARVGVRIRIRVRVRIGVRAR